MAFYPIKNADQGLLDWLWANARKHAGRTCPDCAVKPGEPHDVNCDVPRCPIHKIQALMAPCEGCPQNPCKLIWHGVWPGKWECYKLGLVTFDTATDCIMFDLNEWHRRGCPAIEDDSSDVISKGVTWLDPDKGKPDKPNRGDAILIPSGEDFSVEVFDGEAWIPWLRWWSQAAGDSTRSPEG